MEIIKTILGRLFISFGKSNSDMVHGIGWELMGFYYVECCNVIYYLK